MGRGESLHLGFAASLLQFHAKIRSLNQRTSKGALNLPLMASCENEIYLQTILERGLQHCTCISFHQNCFRYYNSSRWLKEDSFSLLHIVVNTCKYRLSKTVFYGPFMCQLLRQRYAILNYGVKYGYQQTSTSGQDIIIYSQLLFLLLHLLNLDIQNTYPVSFIRTWASRFNCRACMYG